MRPLRSQDGSPRGDPAASMALLQEVLDRPLDPGYESSAHARQTRGLSPSTGSRTPLLLATAVLLGFLLAVAAQTLRTPDPAAAQARSELIERVRGSQHLVEEQAARIEGLHANLVALEDAGVQEDDGGHAEQVRAAGLHAGATAMVGPGVVVTLDDAPPPPASVDGVVVEDVERVLAGDLQVLVNGLWANGAEAVAINEQRLTSTSAIRFAGEAIVVDFRGLTRPYTVRAIGPVEDLEAELGSGATGRYLQDLRDQYGIITEVTPQDQITVPAATRLTTREAQVVPDSTIPSGQEDDR